MSLEEFSKNFKIVIDEQGIKRIYKIEHQMEAERYIDEAIQTYKDKFSSEVKNMIFHYFRTKDKSFVLIIDNEGRNYRYDCQKKTILNKKQT